MKLSVADVLARFLAEAGVGHVFGVSGHPLFDITDAIYRQPGLELVPSTMELTGAYMANAYAIAGRRLGACMGSAGPGVTNLVTGVAEAAKESTPLFAFGADVDAHVSNKGASSWHELPQAEVMAPLTKLSRTLREPKRVLEALVEAHHEATTGRMGPVYLGFPPDVQEAEVEVPDQPWLADPPKPSAADQTSIERAAARLAAARAPSIIVGRGVYWASAEAEVLRLAELLDAPVGTSHASKGIVPDTHPNSVSVVGYGAFPAPFGGEAIQQADVLLAVGSTFSEGMTHGYGHRLIPEGVSIVQIDADAAELGKSYPVEIGIVGDAKQALQALLAALGTRQLEHKAERAARMERLRRQKAEFLAELERRGSSAEGPITHAHILHAVQKVAPKDAMLVEAGCTGELLSCTVASEPVYQSGDFRAIGHGLASAIGIQYALPRRQVAAITGDGSFMMELAELATARRSGYPLLTVLVHNDAYGGMRRDQIRHYERRIIGTELQLPEFPELAAAFGVHGRRVSQPAELELAIREALQAGGAALIDALCPVAGV